LDSIFIQIPSYRDLELPKTIVDAVAKASGKYRLVFGIHSCIAYSGEILIPFIESDLATIKYVESIAPNNIGLQLSRHIANELYTDEDYYLQIDAHMRFMPNWDEIAVADLKYYQDLGIKKPLISGYPPSYHYREDTEVLEDKTVFHTTRMSFLKNPIAFEKSYIPSQDAVVAPKGCIYGTSVAGGLIFTVGDFAKIKPNKKIAFWGEEILIAARAFTHGFTPVLPVHHLLWHLYFDTQPDGFTRRESVWADYPDLWPELDMLSKLELIDIFNNARIGDDALGTERTLEDYGNFAGLDFKNRRVTQRWGL
jgi:hypothetical protein